MDRIWWEYQVAGGQSERVPFNMEAQGYSTLKVVKEQPEALDLKELQDEITDSPTGTEKSETDEAGPVAGAPRLALKEGQELTVVIKAQDRSTLEGGPFVGTSDKYELDVVSPDELLAALENREAELRRRFETIVEEFSATRELLSRVQFASSLRALATVPARNQKIGWKKHWKRSKAKEILTTKMARPTRRRKQRATAPPAVWLSSEPPRTPNAPRTRRARLGRPFTRSWRKWQTTGSTLRHFKGDFAMK